MLLSWHARLRVSRQSRTTEDGSLIILRTFKLVFEDFSSVTLSSLGLLSLFVLKCCDTMLFLEAVDLTATPFLVPLSDSVS